MAWKKMGGVSGQPKSKGKLVMVWWEIVEWKKFEWVGADMQKALAAATVDISKVLEEHWLVLVGDTNLGLNLGMTEKMRKIDRIRDQVSRMLDLLSESEFLSLFYPTGMPNEWIFKKINQERVDRINMILVCLYKIKRVFAINKEANLIDEKLIQKIITLVSEFGTLVRDYYNHLKERNPGEFDPTVEVEKQKEIKQWLIWRMDEVLKNSVRASFWLDESLSEDQKQYLEKIMFFIFMETPSFFPHIMNLVYDKNVPKEMIIEELEKNIEFHKLGIRGKFKREISEKITQKKDLAGLSFEEMIWLVENEEDRESLVQELGSFDDALADLDETKEWLWEAADYFIANFRSK